MGMLRALFWGASLVVAAGLSPQPAVPASGQGALVRVVAPATWQPDGGSFDVRVEVEGVGELGGFALKLAFDPVVLGFDGVEAGSFLGSTGRSVGCSEADFFTPQYDIFAFACATTGQEPGGPSGSGVLVVARFHPIAGGPSPLHLAGVKLTDSLGREIVATLRQGSVTVGRSADTPVPTATPVGTLPGAHGPNTSPSPVSTGYGVLPLAAGCSPITSTFPDGTPISQIANGVSPADILGALWRFETGGWLGYSPRFPAVSDLTRTGPAGVLFVCVSASGEFLRPRA